MKGTVFERVRPRLRHPRWAERPSIDRENRLCAALARLWRLRQRDRAKWAAERAVLLAQVQRAEEVARKLQVTVGQHARARFGRRSEQQPGEGCAAAEGRRRGQRPGARGHGRRRERYAGLPEEHVEHDVAEEDKVCHRCGSPLVLLADDTSEELDVELRVRRKVHHRLTYAATCRCAGRERIVRGGAPVKLIPRGSLSTGTIAWAVTARYMWGLPLHRITTILTQHGASVSDGTFVGVFQAVQPLLQPIYEAVCARNRQSPYLHADETTWRQLWLTKGKRGYIWCFVGLDTTAYLFDPGRDHTVVLRYLGLDGTDWGGQVVDLICDFLASYDKAARVANATERRLELSRCWAHYRRLFLDIPAHHRGDGRVAAEVEQWLGMIADLFYLHHRRDLAPDGSEEQQEAQTVFRGCLEEMAYVRAQHLSQRTLAPELRHVLEFGAEHWEELTRCADDPHHPIDNNLDERQERLPVVIRKNAYGSGARWAVDQACQVWSIGQTLVQNGGQPLAWTLAYFAACAQARGTVPEDWIRFVPWAWHPSPAAAATERPGGAPQNTGPAGDGPTNGSPEPAAATLPEAPCADDEDAAPAMPPASLYGAPQNTGLAGNGPTNGSPEPAAATTPEAPCADDEGTAPAMPSAPAEQTCAQMPFAGPASARSAHRRNLAPFHRPSNAVGPPAGGARAASATPGPQRASLRRTRNPALPP